MKKLMAGAAVAVALTAAAGAAQAQTPATINVSATVTGALTAVTIQPMAFGFVVPGSPKTVNLTDAGAGIVEFTGTPLAGVNISFTSLPTDLTSGANTLGIASYAAATSATQAGAQSSFTPVSGTAVFLATGTGRVYVHVGATVSPTGAQAAGPYTGTIALQAAYNGN